MSETLLQTKLNIPPPRPNLVPRPGLIERLNEGLSPEKRLSLVSAAAGFGKTTLVSEWVHGGGLAAAWLSLDRGDNDLTRFLSYVVAALQSLDCTIGVGVLALLQSPQPPIAEMILTAVLNELVETLADSPADNHFALVLDDYHLIEAQTVHDAVTFMLDHVPPQLHLVVASRTDPPLPLPRLRVRGQMVELREANLRFTVDETASLFNQALGLRLSAEDITALERRTEGWIAGLQVAALSMKGHEDANEFISAFTGSHRYIMDYLVEEVLDRQAEDVQDFLQHTAILDRITGPLCDALTGRTGGWEVLEGLERDNLFIVPLDNDRLWYRYHHLFADLLRTKMDQAMPELVPELHGRASEWYEANGFVDEAAKHALQAGRFETAAKLIEKVGEALWERGEPTSILEWLTELPDEQVVTRPSLCNLHAWALYMNGQNEAAEARLLSAAQTLTLSEVDDTEQLGRVAAIRGAIASRRGDIPGIYQFCDQALQYLPEDSLLWRTVSMMALGFAQDLDGDTRAAYETWAEAVRLSEAAGNSYLILSTNLHLGTILLRQGRLKEMHQLCQELFLFARAGRILHTEMAGCLYDEMGWLLVEWNELDKAMRYLEKGSELSRQGFDIGVLGWSYLAMLRAQFARRDWPAAQGVIRQMEMMEKASDVPPWYTSPKEAWKARVMLAEGDIEAACRWADESGLQASDDPHYSREDEYVALLRVLNAQELTAEVDELAGRVLAKAREGGRNDTMVQVLLIQAQSFQRRGELTRALELLELALCLAEQGGALQLFLDEGDMMTELLSVFSQRPSSVGQDYLNTVVAAFEGGKLPGRSRETSEQVARQAELVEPLSERELEVLRLLATGLPYREIAAELYVSINTVKAHAKNIYSKLGVHGRMHAAQRAKELKLL